MPECKPHNLGSYACSREEILAIRRGTITTIVGPANYLGVGGKLRRSGWYKARPGDFIWLKEPCKEFICKGHETHRDLQYDADFKSGFCRPRLTPIGRRGWKQITHQPKALPRHLSRTTLEIVGKSFGNIWDISQDDALFCGIIRSPFTPFEHFEYAAGGGCDALRHQYAFARMFGARYGKIPATENPPYIALAFKVHEKNIGEMLGEDPKTPLTAPREEPPHDHDALIKRMDALIAGAKSANGNTAPKSTTDDTP